MVEGCTLPFPLLPLIQDRLSSWCRELSESDGMEVKYDPCSPKPVAICTRGLRAETRRTNRGKGVLEEILQQSFWS